MRIIGTVEEVPQIIGRGKGALSPEIIEIREALNSAGGSFLQVEFDVEKMARNRCNRLKRMGYFAAVRGKTTLYVGRNGSS